MIIITFLLILQDFSINTFNNTILVTTLPAPITQPDTILTGKIVEFEPIKTLFSIFVSFQFFKLPPNFPYEKI